MTLGRIPLAMPVRAAWPHPDLPPTVHLQGRTFRQTSLALPVAGAVGHYREAVPFQSAHLVILDDGTYLIDHIDEANPDMGQAAAHAALDAPEALTAGLAVAGLLLGFVGGWILWRAP
jgi:hypothetical protein